MISMPTETFEKLVDERNSLINTLARERDEFGKKEIEFKNQIEKSTCKECEGTCGGHALNCPDNVMALKAKLAEAEMALDVIGQMTVCPMRDNDDKERLSLIGIEVGEALSKIRGEK